jgi:hypothetical protein
MSPSRATPAFFFSGGQAVNLVYVVRAWQDTVQYMTMRGFTPAPRTWYLLSRGPEREVSFTGYEARRAWKALELYRARTTRPARTKGATP